MTIRVPIAALKLPRAMMASDEAEGEVVPEAGDPVSFHIEGVVGSIGDGFFEVEPRFINGERAVSSEVPKEQKAEKSEEESLAEAAAAADEEEMY